MVGRGERDAARWLVGCVASVALVLGCEQRPEPDEAAPADTDLSALAAPAAGRGADTAPDSTLTSAGWGNLRIGMSRSEVEAAAGEDAHPEAVGGPDPATCDEFRPVRAPDGLLVMIRNGRLTRISITEGSGIITDRGIAVGDSVSEVLEAYGPEATSSPHTYHAAPAQYLTVWAVPPPAPAARGIVYEIAENGRVLRILAGDGSIEVPEGCV